MKKRQRVELYFDNPNDNEKIITLVLDEKKSKKLINFFKQGKEHTLTLFPDYEDEGD